MVCMFGYRNKVLSASALSPSAMTEQGWQLAAPLSGPRSSPVDFPLLRLSATVVCLLGLPALAHADPAFLGPAGLPAGSPYRLIFVTSTLTPATSGNLPDYNTFVTDAATLNSGLPKTTWTAIASTEGESAVDNVTAGCAGGCLSVPIYLVDGTTLIANNQGQLFSGTILNTITEDEHGSALSTSKSNYVWTGSNADGTTDPGEALGDANPMAGTANSTTSYLVSFSGFSSSTSFPLYAISGQLTVPTSTPEPMSGSLLLAGGAATGLVRRLRRKRQPPAR
jgi:hypothetical protein